jgi:hypothetical protein
MPQPCSASWKKYRKRSTKSRNTSFTNRVNAAGAGRFVPVLAFSHAHQGDQTYRAEQSVMLTAALGA